MTFSEVTKLCLTLDVAVFECKVMLLICVIHKVGRLLLNCPVFICNNIVFEVMCVLDVHNFYAVVYCVIMFQLGTTSVQLPLGGLYPAVGMHSVGEEVRLFLGLNWIPEEDRLMSVDTNEEEWYRLNDIRLNGQVCC